MYFRVVQQSRDALAFQVVLEGERVGLTSVEFRDQTAVQRAIEAVIASLREGVDASLQVDGDSYHFTLRGEDGGLLARGNAYASPAQADAGLAELQHWAGTVERFRVVNLARPQKSGARPVDTIQVAVRYDLEACSRAKKSGLELLNRASDGLFTAHVHGERGEVLLYLRGFTTRFARDEQVESVLVAAADPRRYDRREAEGRRYFVLTARNGREIARSPWLASEVECDAAIAQLVQLAPGEAKEYVAARTRRKVAESGYDLTRRSTSGVAGFEAFRADDGHHYFHFNDERGEVLLFSHGYSTPKARDHGIRSLLKGAGDPVCYRVAADELRFAISAVNGRELARSRLFGSRAALDRAIAWIRSDIVQFGRKYGIRLWESSFIELPHELAGSDGSAPSQDPDELARQALDASGDATLSRLAAPAPAPAPNASSRQSPGARPDATAPSPESPRQDSARDAHSSTLAPRPDSPPPDASPSNLAPRPDSPSAPDAPPSNLPARPDSPSAPDASPPNLPARPDSPSAPDASPSNLASRPDSPSAPDASPSNLPARPDSPSAPDASPSNLPARLDSPHSSAPDALPSDLHSPSDSPRSVSPSNLASPPKSSHPSSPAVPLSHLASPSDSPPLSSSDASALPSNLASQPDPPRPRSSDASGPVAHSSDLSSPEAADLSRVPEPHSPGSVDHTPSLHSPGSVDPVGALHSLDSAPLASSRQSPDSVAPSLHSPDSVDPAGSIDPTLSLHSSGSVGPADSLHSPATDPRHPLAPVAVPSEPQDPASATLSPALTLDAAVRPEGAGPLREDVDAIELPELQLFDPSPRRSDSLPRPPAADPDPPSGPFSARELDDALAPLTALEFDDAAPIAIDPEDSATFAAASVHALPHVPLADEDSLTIELGSTDLSTFAPASPHHPPPPLPVEPPTIRAAHESEPPPRSVPEHPHSLDLSLSHPPQRPDVSPHSPLDPSHSHGSHSTSEPTHPLDLSLPHPPQHPDVSLQSPPYRPHPLDLSLARPQGPEPRQPAGPVRPRPPPHPRAVATFPPPFTPTPIEEPEVATSVQSEDSLTIELDSPDASTFAAAESMRAASILETPPDGEQDPSQSLVLVEAAPFTEAAVILGSGPASIETTVDEPRPRATPDMSSRSHEDSLTLALDALEAPTAPLEALAVPASSSSPDADTPPPVQSSPADGPAHSQPPPPATTASLTGRGDAPLLASLASESPRLRDAATLSSSPEAREDSLTRALDALDLASASQPPSAGTVRSADLPSRAAEARDDSPLREPLAPSPDPVSPLQAREDSLTRALDTLDVSPTEPASAGTDVTLDLPSPSTGPREESRPHLTPSRDHTSSLSRREDSLTRALDALDVSSPEAPSAPDHPPREPESSADSQSLESLAPAPDSTNAREASQPHRAPSPHLSAPLLRRDDSPEDHLTPAPGPNAPRLRPEDSLTRALDALDVSSPSEATPADTAARLDLPAHPRPHAPQAAEASLPFSADPPNYAIEDLAPQPGDSLTSLAAIAAQDSGGFSAPSRSIDPGDSLTAAIDGLQAPEITDHDPADSLSAIARLQSPAHPRASGDARSAENAASDSSAAPQSPDLDHGDSLTAAIDGLKAPEITDQDPADSLFAIARLQSPTHPRASGDARSAENAASDSSAAPQSPDLDHGDVITALQSRDLTPPRLDSGDSLSAIAQLEDDSPSRDLSATPGDSLSAIAQLEDDSPSRDLSATPGDSLSAIAQLVDDSPSHDLSAAPGDSLSTLAGRDSHYSESPDLSPDPDDSLSTLVGRDSHYSESPDLSAPPGDSTLVGRDSHHSESPDLSPDPGDSLSTLADRDSHYSESPDLSAPPGNSLSALADREPRASGVRPSPGARVDLHRSPPLREPAPVPDPADSLTDLAVLDPQDSGSAPVSIDPGDSLNPLTARDPQDPGDAPASHRVDPADSLNALTARDPQDPGDAPASHRVDPADSLNALTARDPQDPGDVSASPRVDPADSLTALAILDPPDSIGPPRRRTERWAPVFLTRERSGPSQAPSPAESLTSLAVLEPDDDDAPRPPPIASRDSRPFPLVDDDDDADDTDLSATDPAAPPEPIAESILAAPQPEQSSRSDSAHSSSDPPVLVQPPLLSPLEDAAPLYRLSAPPLPVHAGPLISEVAPAEPAPAATAPHGDDAVADDSAPSRASGPRQSASRPESRPTARQPPRPPSAGSSRPRSEPSTAAEPSRAPSGHSPPAREPSGGAPRAVGSAHSQPPHAPTDTSRRRSAPFSEPPRPHIPSNESSRPHPAASPSSSPLAPTGDSSRPHPAASLPSSPLATTGDSSRPHPAASLPSSPLATTGDSSRPHPAAPLPSSPLAPTGDSSRPHPAASLPSSPRPHTPSGDSSRPLPAASPPSAPLAHARSGDSSRPHADALEPLTAPGLSSESSHPAAPSRAHESSAPRSQESSLSPGGSLTPPDDSSNRASAGEPPPTEPTRAPHQPAEAPAGRDESTPAVALDESFPARSSAPHFASSLPAAASAITASPLPDPARVAPPAAWIPPHRPASGSGFIPPITNPYPRPFIPPGTLAALGLASRPGSANAASTSPAPGTSLVAGTSAPSTSPAPDTSPGAPLLTPEPPPPAPFLDPPVSGPVSPFDATLLPDLGLLVARDLGGDLPRAEAPALVPELDILLRDTIAGPRKREGSAPLFAARREPSSTHAVPTLLARREPSSAQSSPALVPALDLLELESPSGPKPRRSLPNLIPGPGAPVTVILDRPLADPPLRRSLPNLIPEPGASLPPLSLVESARREPPASEPPVPKDISQSAPAASPPIPLHDLPTLVQVGLAVTQPAPVKPADAPVPPTKVPLTIPRLPPIRMAPSARDRWLRVGVVLAALVFLGAVASRLNRSSEPASEVAERASDESLDRVEPPPVEPPPAEPPPAVIPPSPAPPLAGAALDCPESADPAIGLMVTPFAPLAGQPLRIVAATLADDVPLALHLLAGDAPAQPLDAHVHPGTPSSVIADFTPASAGEVTFAVVRDGAAITCLKVQVLGEPPQRPPFAAKGRAWPVERAWTAGEEALYSAWVRQLFSASPDPKASIERLDVATGDPARNFLHDALGLQEDRADNPVGLRLKPDGADLPYFVRAYWSWKRRLPFAYRKCQRGGDGKPPRCGDARTNLDPGPGFTMPATELARAQRFFFRNLGWGVHAGNARTAVGDSTSDLYPVRLDHRGLRPGAVYADPYGHVFLLVDLVPAQDGEPGALLAVDGEPDGQIVRREFWEGLFLWSTEPALGGVGFKQFRPVVRQAGGGLAQLSDAAIAAAPDLGDIWTAPGELAGTAFYDAVIALVEPPPWDASQRQREAVAAFAELARSRVEPIARAAEFARDRQRAIAMPKGWEVFEATGAWESHSTPGRDLRLLIALDVVRGLPDRVRARPNLYATDGDPEARARALADELDVLLRDPRHAITYTRSDGSEWTLGLRDLVDREAALELAYNPNDCPELRWGAPEGSDELSTCSFRAPEDQRARMEAYRGWLHQRRPPARGDKSP
ncbi:hypothetical protein [Nannocystis punicea]|uniref:Uncharacterized protein n=1 Tax=Nannocystis punicea TaxID=2995304 RepID=A0ABY7H088_9BACT|nr:hypothetical protein [Nannocystis poenicansa]WAS92598.1 hypothetical protein O0S08_40985 [Nannocystis poenicansa]